MTSLISIRVIAASFDPEKEIAAFRRAHPQSGAIVSFLGAVRSEDETVSQLTLDSYPGFTEQEIARIAADGTARWRIDGLLVIHRIGALAPSEPIVLAAAAAAHRRDAFCAVDYMMDYLKSEAPFWKRESTAQGDRWIEPRAADYADKKRWAR
jgi:molybdopterin synthase catalytic subunit